MSAHGEVSCEVGIPHRVHRFDLRAAHIGHFTVICTNYLNQFELLNQLLNQFLKVNQLLNHYPLSNPCNQFIPYMYYFFA